MTSYTKRFILSSLIVFLFNLLGGVLGYVTRVFYGRIITVEQFGLIYAVTNFVIFLVAFRNFGLNEALSKFIPEFKIKKRLEDINKSINLTFLVQMGIVTVIFAAAFLLSDQLASHYFHSPEAAYVLRWVLVGFWFNCIVDVFCFAFVGNNNMTTYASVQFAKTFAILAISAVLFYLKFGFKSAVYANSLFSLVLLIIYAPIFLSKFPGIFKSGIAGKRLTKSVMRYSVPLVIGSFGAMGISFADTFLLTYLAGLQDVALYQVAWPTAYFLMLLSFPIVTVLFPMVSEFWAKKRTDMIVLGLERIYKYFLMIILPPAIVLIAYAPQIVRILFEEKFLPASTALMVLSVGFIFMNLASITIAAINGIGQSRMTAKVMLISAAVNIALNAALIPFYGFLGAAVATSICYLSMFLLSFVFLREKVKLRLPIKYWLLIGIMGTIYLVLLETAKNILNFDLANTLLVLAVSTAIYAGLLVLTRIVTINELKELYSMVVKG